ncbi:hypothetical protein ACE1MK_15540 [Tenacibaculum maritimum]|uniref:hypothetical protein n=1 Tax=Tenacibaculum maritimum TaxID=107401 RepID=UPI0013311315|nr:hypothetical protein [Tenacibaculum maritimum]MCD9582942.1 hypothetical protein [Tenacibaculum maritimum]MCD9635980.1 hypothetical protein [Tenacibaculum maritimum]
MNTFLKTLAALLFVGMVSCTDTTEETIKTLDGKQELFGINKEDSFTDDPRDGGGDRDNPDGYEE